ncbi:MAG: ACT domain-containing protein [Paracoccaceae bacterium]
MSNLILTISCPMRSGIVAEISTFLAAKGCNIHDSSQFSDLDERSLLHAVTSPRAGEPARR